MQILRKRLAIECADFISEFTIPHFTCSVTRNEKTNKSKRRGWSSDEFCYRIEFNKCNFSVMSIQGQNRFCNVLCWSSFRELPKLPIRQENNPNHHRKVGRWTNNLLVIEWVEVKIAQVTPTHWSEKNYGYLCPVSRGRVAGILPGVLCARIKIGPPPPPAGKAKYFALPLI